MSGFIEELTAIKKEVALYTQRSSIIKKTPRRKLPNNDQLKHIYDCITARLNQEFAIETLVTHAERRLKSRIERYTRLDVFNSVWIGSRNIDFFIPPIRGNSLKLPTVKRGFHGLAIEVDGGIHNCELKMRKDQSKYECLNRLGISLFVVENGDINAKTVTELIERLKKLRRIDTRARKRLWRKIHLETILRKATNSEFFSLFPHCPRKEQ